jgi:hypothetical protein
VAATILNRRRKGPATHALVIGVGHYPHLPGGGGKPRYAGNDGLAQLKSPPESARQVARWIAESFESTERPLGSLSLLTSEKNPRPFKYRIKGKTKSVTAEAASITNVEAAIREWRRRGDSHEGNLLVFFFCGHGIAAGSELALLMQDFGAVPAAPLDGALNFRGTYRGMEECLAREQVYFIDACRVGSPLLQNNNGAGTRTPVQWTGAVDIPSGRRRLGPTFYSTLPDASAYAKAGEASVFTQALLACLAGAASGNETGNGWRVRTSRLVDALDYLMAQASEEIGLQTAQIPSTDDGVKVELNTLQAPVVPVVVQLDPAAALPLATLRCENGKFKDRRAPRAAPWRLALAPADYNFFADFKGRQFKAASMLDEAVLPPFWAKPLRWVRDQAQVADQQVPGGRWAPGPAGAGQDLFAGCAGINPAVSPHAPGGHPDQP